MTRPSPDLFRQVEAESVANDHVFQNLLAFWHDKAESDILDASAIYKLCAHIRSIIAAQGAAGEQEGYERGFIDGQEKVDIFRQHLIKAEAALAATSHITPHAATMDAPCNCTEAQRLACQVCAPGGIIDQAHAAVAKRAGTVTLDADAAIQANKPQLYTYMGESGMYALIGHPCAAGVLRDVMITNDFTVYRDTTSGMMFVRLASDFAERMEPIAAPAAPTGIKPDPKALVALALSGSLPDTQAGEILRDAFTPAAPTDAVTLTKQQLSDYRARIIAETVEKFAGAPTDVGVRDKALDESASIAVTLTKVPGDLMGQPNDAMLRVATAGERIATAILALKSSPKAPKQ